MRKTNCVLLLIGVCGGLFGCGSHTIPDMPTGPSRSVDNPPGNIRFVDVTEAAGIHYRWEIRAKRPLNILQTIGNGCALLDYDNDGNLDVLLVGPHVALYRGDGHGHFTDVTHAMGLDKLSGDFLGCAIGDYDNDGYDDIYLSAYRGGALLHNEHGHGFKDVTREAGIAPQPWGTSCAFADVDGDGKLDLYIGNYVRFGPESALQLCQKQGHMTACGPRVYDAEKGVLYHNEGGGRFRDVTQAWGAQAVSGKSLGMAFADYDGSGRQSLVIANDEMPGDLLRNEAAAGVRFVNVGKQAGTAYDRDGNEYGGMGVDWGDYDNNGKLDLAVGTYQNQLKGIYHNLGRGLFETEAQELGIPETTVPDVAFGVKWLDVDNDGWLDLMITNGHVQDNIADMDPSTTYKEATQLFHNEKGAHFSDIGAQAGEAFQRRIMGRGLAIGDFDNDGRIDVLIADGEGAPLLLHNETLRAGHWLSFKLTGTKSNRDGIGATVTVEAGGLTQTRVCHTDGSYMAASDRRVHVGLGSASVASRVTVRWPSGTVDVYRNIAADQVLELKEGGANAH